MIAKLFDLQNFKVVPTVHCHSIIWLKVIMDEYQEDDEYLKVYQYLYYMTFPSPEENPYFHFKQSEKSDEILRAIEANFSTEDESVIIALRNLKKMYETPTSRAYDGISGMMDKLAKFMKTEEITTGRDGNMSAIVAAAKSYDQIRQSFKGAFKDLQEETQSRVRGDKGLGYDQM
jgi:hypothetical protein